MTRVIALTVAVVFVGTSSGFAETLRPVAVITPAPGATRIDFSPRAAGIDTMAAVRARKVVKADARAPRALQSTQQRSFWRSPWPYAIIAGVVVAGVIIANASGDGNGY